MRSSGNRVAGEKVFGLIDNDDLRVQILFVLNDDIATNAGGFVDFLTNGHTRDHITELNATGLFGDNWNVVRIPLHECDTFFNSASVGNGDDGTDDNVVAFKFTTILRMKRDGAVFVENDEGFIHGFHDFEFVETDGAVVFGFDDWLLERLARSTADVEGSHRKLCAGFADGLSSNDAHSFTDLDHATCSKTAAVAFDTNTALGFAGQRRTNLELLMADFFQSGCSLLINELIFFEDCLARDRIFNGFAGRAADDTSR